MKTPHFKIVQSSRWASGGKSSCIRHFVCNLFFPMFVSIKTNHLPYNWSVSPLLSLAPSKVPQLYAQMCENKGLKLYYIMRVHVADARGRSNKDCTVHKTLWVNRHGAWESKEERVKIVMRVGTEWGEREREWMNEWKWPLKVASASGFKRA